MNIKILSSLSRETENRNALIIGTHNGVFHADELVACAMLCLHYPNDSLRILRTRDDAMLSQCDICVDIGGGAFDHHMPGFNKKRENGIPYASAGLVWKEFGESLIQLTAGKYFPGTQCDFDAIFQSFDDSVISLVDCEDTGKKAEKHCFSFISSFLPLWFYERLEDFNDQFQQALLVTISVFEQELKRAFVKEISKDIIESNWKNAEFFKNGILELPGQTVLWVEPTIRINNSTENPINFVIFPYPDGGWAAQCVPPSLENNFGKRIPFPASWAGQTDNLAKIAGIEGAWSCSNGRFFARAISKEAIISMCLACQG